MKTNFGVVMVVACASLRCGAQTNIFPSSGNVGIGTTSPSAALDVIHSGQAEIRIEDGNRKWSMLSNAAWGADGFSIYDITANAPRLQIASNGFVGLNTTAPTAMLHVSGDGTLSARFSSGGVEFERSLISFVDLNDTGPSGISWRLSSDSNTYSGSFCIEQASGFPAFSIQKNTGNIGIGTTAPGMGTTVVGEKLDVENGYIRIGHPNGPFFNFYQPGAATDLKFCRIGSIGGDMYFDAINDAYTTPATRIFVQHSTGNVGIGTTAPTQKLAVNGTIRAKEVIVDTNWSDYVFAKGYRLPSLFEVEQQVQRQGHLPGVPSAADVAKKGLSVGDMQAILLAKIEELTLHQIAQEKRLAAQDAKIETQDAEIARLKASMP